MKKTVKISALILEVILILFTFSGCWNYHELETYSIVSGIAIDKGLNGYKYHITFECIKMSGGGAGAEIEPLLLEEDGNTFFDTVRSTLRESDKKLYFNHCKIAILSPEIAKAGIKSLIDWVQRDSEPRLTMDLLVSREETAGDILRVKPQSGQILSYQIAGTLDEVTGYYGSSTGVQLYEASDILNTEGISLVLPAIEKKKEASGETVQFSGGAIFKGDRQIGWLASNSNKYYDMVRDKVKGGLLMTGPTPGSTQICLEIRKSETNVTPVVSGQTVSAQIQVQMKVSYAEQDSEKDELTQTGIDKVEEYAEKTVEYGIESVVKEVQQNDNSDIFGFGSHIYQNNRKEWERLSPKWHEIFKTMKVNVEAEVEIENTGLSRAKAGD
ncbi:MAG: Ger(x)C family spore germination protein [Oscillospiraceae bacterium]|jgi:spore germination protein KC|nr:Ger(x)C family spore germination protein [Oscillospiraceae bacterium]